MAHYAFLDENNIVTEVIVGIDENELIEGKDPETWYGDFRGQKCVRTSYNHKIRKQYAGIGFTYDPISDVFIAPQTFPSWILDSNHDWQPPKAKPDEGFWIWNEEVGDWVEKEENSLA
jgi:hypothetical protein